MDISDIKNYLSGGAANSVYADSYGGIISSTELLTNTFTPTSSIAGITILKVFATVEGDYTLHYNGTGILKLAAPYLTAPALYGALIDITMGGVFVLSDLPGKGFFVVSIVPGSLPALTTTGITAVQFPPDRTLESKALTSGQTVSDYRCFYIKNTHATDTAYSVGIYIDTQLLASTETLSVGLDPAGLGDGSTTGVAATPADQNTAPAGVTFSSPTTEATRLILGDLAPGVTRAIWLHRAVSGPPPVDRIYDFFGVLIAAQL